MISVLIWSVRQSWFVHLLKLNNIEEINGWHIILIAGICITNWITTSAIMCMLLISQLLSLFGKHCLIVIILYMCITMTQSTLTHCYHLIPVCHNDTKYIDTLWSSYTCVSQWHKVHCHLVITLYMCIIMTQSTLPHCCYLIHVCHNDTKYIDTLL